MRKIIYQRTDGGISVVTPAFNLNDPAGWTEADSEQRAWDKLPPDAINPRFADESEIPADRTFRNAWKADLTVDMVKAREIHRAKLRDIRKPLLEALDTDYMRADEAGDTALKAQIASKKQALRDVTDDPAIAAATSPEELKAVLPSVLTDADIKAAKQ